MSRRDAPVSDLVIGLVNDLRRAGLKDSDIAQKTGLSRSTVWRMGQGDARNPDYNTVQRLQNLRDKVRR